MYCQYKYFLKNIGFFETYMTALLDGEAFLSKLRIFLLARATLWNKIQD